MKYMKKESASVQVITFTKRSRKIYNVQMDTIYELFTTYEICSSYSLL